MYMSNKKIIMADMMALKEAKTEANFLSGNKSAYIAEKVSKYNQLWWANLTDMLSSDDKAERNTAMIEYNKLQCRVLPTQITGADGKDLLPIPILSNVRNFDIDATNDTISNNDTNLLTDGVHSDNGTEEGVTIIEED
jgi:hypothetical protein